MKLRLLIASSVFVWVSSALAAPPAPAAAAAPAGPCEGLAGAEATSCWAKEVSAVQVTLNEKIAAASDKLKAAKKDALVEVLKKSQYDWVVSRTSHCEFIEKAEAGTAVAAISRSACLYRTTQSRIAAVGLLISNLGG
ncbi:MAG: DUF1311 domain-containing protein [Myxococcaceae bacterium]|nr:DUF1311 domain-containing protein [Myxococcaceae bacterium]